VEAAATAVADLAGITPQEARMRLVLEPPAPLALLAPDKAAAAVEKLRQAGLAVVAPPMPPPTDKQRVLARSFTLGPAALSVKPRAGEPVELAWSQVGAILRGAVASRTETESIERKVVTTLGMGLDGNLKAHSEIIKKREVSVNEGTEQVIYVFGKDGKRIALYEHGLEFSGLGPRKEVGRFQNTVLLAKLLREQAPQAFYDERLVRLGRRQLPAFLRSHANREPTSPTTEHTDTRVTLDLLSEALWLGVSEGVLP
jgi:hypothetical protein